MKILQATSLTNGERSDDCNECIEGELVMLGPGCALCLQYQEHECLLSRTFSGLATHKATTSVIVSTTELSEDDMLLAFHTSLSDRGWLTPLSPSQGREAAADLLDDMLEVADYYDDGTVIGKSVEGTFVRRRANISG